MKKVITSFLTVLTIGITAWADIPVGYYSNAIGKHDEALMTALEGIIYTHTQLSYNYMWTAFDATDLGSDGYYIDMYSTCKYNNQSDHVGGASYVGEGINREHSFPKSWFGGEVFPMFTDLTMLIPTDAYVNQRRNNHPYGVCAGGITYTNEQMGVTMKGKLGTSTYNGYTATVFEPDDEYKGDFARIYFYMVTCYKSDISNWPGCDQLDYTNNNYKAFSNWSMQLLMEWHRADPVSQKEIKRNEAVYSEQGNRNPFIDHPELAEYIWGIKQNANWTGEDTPDPIVKEVPVMLAVDTTAVTGSSFRADWTAVENVSSYTLQVNRIAVPGDETTTLLMTENFSKINTTVDGNRDIGEMLDNYTDNPGWTGYKVYTAAGQSVKIGTSNESGYITSPELELGPTITVVFNAKNWIGSAGSDGSSVIVSCGDVSQTIPLTDTPTDYTVVLRGCSSKNVKLAMTAPKKRFYVFNVSIYNGDLTAKTNGPRRVIIEEGDSTWRTVSGITDNQYTVQGLAGGVYEYMVKAIYTDGDASVWSNIQHVTIVGNGDEPLIGDVNHDGEVNIMDITAIIDVVLKGATAYDEISDINHDGEVTITDVTELIDIILGN